MLNTYEEEEVFFDTKDHLTLEDSNIFQDEIIDLEHDIWLSEPRSVKERREIFLSRMGFAEHSNETSKEVTEYIEADLGHVESSTVSTCDNLLLERRESNSEAHCSVDYSDMDWLDLDDICIDDVNVEIDENLDSVNQTRACVRESPSVVKTSNNLSNWWKQFARRKMKKNRAVNLSKEPRSARMRVEQNRKRYTELTAVYSGQKLKAHDGLIWTMKFSSDGKYLASGGEDGVVCVWRVSMLEVSSDEDKCSFNRRDNETSSTPRKKKSNHASIIIPEKIFHIEEEPVHKFHGHSSDVLDLAWSRSNHLLSSSMDKTVRLWQVGSDECLGVFRHVNYVTCVQFNPVDENYFISGSIDGKVRIWGMIRQRVEDWVNVRDIVTSVCYQPNGKGFIVGSVSGNCRFYESSGEELVLNAEINMKGKNKSSCNRITSIQFLKNDSQRVIITSDDSKIRILDGLEVVRKYKGMAKSGNQISASFTPNGKHIISVGEDSRLYIWNHDDIHIQSSTKQPKSIRSCEHFSPEGSVTVALPYSNSDTISTNPTYGSIEPARDRQEISSERFSLANWFSMDSSSRASLTWPEEKLPMCDIITSAEHDGVVPCSDEDGDDHLHYHRQLKNDDGDGFKTMPATWGLVFVAANCDGTIRTFYNYGLPVRS